MFNCETCNFKFKYKSQYKVHINSKSHILRTEPPKKIECKQCNYFTYYKTHFNQHIYRHRQKGDLNLKKTIFESSNNNNISASLDSYDDTFDDDFIEDSSMLKKKISSILINLYNNNIDPNKHFNYNYYCNKNINLSIVELNDFYDELKSIKIY